MSNYVYIRSEPSLYTVGFYDPTGRWQPDSDWNTKDEASKRVIELNGGRIVPASGRDRVAFYHHGDPLVGMRGDQVDLLGDFGIFEESELHDILDAVAEALTDGWAEGFMVYWKKE